MVDLQGEAGWPDHMGRIAVDPARVARPRATDDEQTISGRRVRRLILWFALVAPFMAVFVGTRSMTFAIGIVILSHILVLYPTLAATSQWLGPVVTHFSTDEREVWLTIDDGPDPVDTPRILDLLARYRARATFFVRGERVRRYPQEVGAIVRQGHSLGNHSDAHPSARFWCFGPRRIAQEIDQCNKAILDVTGNPTTWFRAPVGMKNPFVHPLLGARGMSLIGWSARGFDAVKNECSAVVRRICKDIKPGTIILAHEGRGAGACNCIEFLVKRLSEEGFSFVIPSQDKLRSRAPAQGGDATKVGNTISAVMPRRSAF